jgi:hypothetical protein
MSDVEQAKGLLARLPPFWRGIAVCLLGTLLLGSLYLLDPAGFLDKWQRDRLDLVERLLNISVLAGTLWVVLFEGDAILAAVARAFAHRFAITFSFITAALERAGLTRESIQSILADIRSRLAATASSPEPQPRSAQPTQQEDDIRNPGPATTQSSQTGAGISTADASVASRQSRWRTIAAAGVLLAIVVALISWGRWGPKQAEPPAAAAIAGPQEVWIRARGSVSETLSRCFGRDLGADAEQAIATDNGITCAETRNGLFCTVQDGQPLRLTAGTTCAPGVQTYDSRSSALAAEE